MMKIEKEIQKAIEVMGYTPLNEVQKQIIPALLDNNDVVVQANTGSGKTAAYTIPLCQHIEFENVYPQVLVLTCTRELTVQVRQEFSRIGKYKKIKALSIYGKESMERQRNALKQGYHAIIATPGRLLDHIKQGNVSLDTIKYLVIDEVDYMFDMGFYPQVEQILDYLPGNVVKSYFSATYTPQIEELIESNSLNYQRFNVMNKLKIDHQYVLCDDLDEAMVETITHCNGESMIVFCQRKDEIDELSKYFSSYNIKHVKLHGDLLQKVRFENLQRFKSGKVRVLLASDVAARGIDIQRVSHVLHYGRPANKYDYIHRSGRTGRVDEFGTSIIVSKDKRFMDVLEYSWKEFEHGEYQNVNTPIEKTDKDKVFKDTVEKLYIGAGKEKKVRTFDIVGTLCSIDNVSQDDIGVVEVLQKISYVEIFNGKASYIVEQMKEKRLKNKVVKVQIAK